MRPTSAQSSDFSLPNTHPLRFNTQPVIHHAFFMLPSPISPACASQYIEVAALQSHEASSVPVQNWYDFPIHRKDLFFHIHSYHLVVVASLSL